MDNEKSLRGFVLKNQKVLTFLLIALIIIVVFFVVKNFKNNGTSECDKLEKSLVQSAKNYFNAKGLNIGEGEKEAVAINTLIQENYVVTDNMPMKGDNCAGNIIVSLANGEYIYSYDVYCNTCSTGQRYGTWTKYQEQKPASTLKKVVEAETLYNYKNLIGGFTPWSDWKDVNETITDISIPAGATELDREAETQIQYRYVEKQYKYYNNVSKEYYDNGKYYETLDNNNYIKDPSTKTVSRTTAWYLSSDKPSSWGNVTYKEETTTGSNAAEAQYIYSKVASTCTKYTYTCSYNSSVKYKCYKRVNLKCPCVKSTTAVDSGAVYTQLAAHDVYTNMISNKANINYIFLNYYSVGGIEKDISYTPVIEANITENGKNYVCTIRGGTRDYTEEPFKECVLNIKDVKNNLQLSYYEVLTGTHLNPSKYKDVSGGGYATSIVCHEENSASTFNGCVTCRNQGSKQHIPGCCGYGNIKQLNIDKATVNSCNLIDNIKKAFQANARWGFKYIQRDDNKLYSSCPAGTVQYLRIPSVSTYINSTGAIIRNEYCTFDKEYKGNGALYGACDSSYPLKEFDSIGASTTVTEVVTDYGKACKSIGGTVKATQPCLSSTTKTTYLKKNGTTTTNKSEAEYMTESEYAKLVKSNAKLKGYQKSKKDNGASYDVNYTGWSSTYTPNTNCNGKSANLCKQTTMVRAVIYKYKWLKKNSNTTYYQSGSYLDTQNNSNLVKDENSSKIVSTGEWTNDILNETSTKDVESRAIKRIRIKYSGGEGLVLNEYVPIADLENAIGKSFTDILSDPDIQIVKKVMYRYREQIVH